MWRTATVAWQGMPTEIRVSQLNFYRDKKQRRKFHIRTQTFEPNDDFCLPRSSALCHRRNSFQYSCNICHLTNFKTQIQK
jgi:hypothetical protein